MFDRVETLFERWTAAFAVIGGLGLLVATAITCVSILLKLLRRCADLLFDPSRVSETAPWLRPILGEEEIVTFAVGAALFCSLPYVMMRRGHIRVDLLQPVFGVRVNKILDLVCDVTLAVLAYLIFTRQWILMIKPARRRQEPLADLVWQGDFEAAMSRLKTAEESQILALPLWPTYAVAQVCVLAFLITAVFCVWRSFRDVARG